MVDGSLQAAPVSQAQLLEQGDSVTAGGPLSPREEPVGFPTDEPLAFLPATQAKAPTAQGYN